MVMVIVSILGILIGTVIGAIAGYFGGIVDAILMRLTDMFLVTPVIVIGAVIGFRFGNLGVIPLAVMLGLFAWMGLARFVRTEFLTLLELLELQIDELSLSTFFQMLWELLSLSVRF
jgi:peptide/nickel transport system permease protein